MTMRQWLLTAVLLAFAQLGCSTAPQAPLERSECSFSGDGVFVLWLERIDLQPGQSTPLTVLWNDGPWSFTEVPAQCVRGWRVADPRVAAVSADGATLIVRDDAPSEATTEVSASIGREVVTGELRVFRRAEQPLVGVWRQEEKQCAKPITELIFRADGTFSVTWIPFETYKDYWGHWRYDAPTDELTLTAESGNYIPPDVQSGSVEILGDTLTMGSASFGSPSRGERCAAPFRRAP